MTLTGRSWSGGRPIRTVDVRVDGPGGTAQPDTVPFNANGYQFWAIARHPVTVG